MIIIPMAGKSSRFYNEGYTCPKYKLPIFNKSNVFSESLKSFKNYFKSDTFLFVHRHDDGSNEFIQKACKKLNIESYILKEIDFDTRGQAETVALGLENLNKEQMKESIYIFNIDSFLLNFKKPSTNFLKNTGGYLELFNGDGDHWSFAKVEGDLVIKTTEKIRISHLCSNGLYYFSTANLFMDVFNELTQINKYKELYIAPMYNILIRKKLFVKYSIINQNQILFCGIPSEYNYLLNKKS